MIEWARNTVEEFQKDMQVTLTEAQVNYLRRAFAKYALAALHDTTIVKEVWAITEEFFCE